MPTLSLISLEVASKSGIGIPEATLFTHGNIFGLRFPFFRKDRGARWATLVNVCVWQSSNLHAECHYCYLVCLFHINSFSLPINIMPNHCPYRPFNPSEIQALRSQDYATDILPGTYSVVRVIRCHRTEYDRHDIHILIQK